MYVLLMILVAVCLEVAGQILYKAGLNQAPGLEGNPLHLANLVRFAWGAVTNLRVLAGLGIYVAEVVVWWAVLSKVDVSYAFPLTSASYVLILLAARLFLHEHVSLERWLGACAIVFGVYLITRSAPLPH